MDLAHWILLLSAALSLYNLGVIWQAQGVSFPLFGMVDSGDFAAYHALYERRIRAVVILPSNLGGLAALVLVFLRPEAVPLWAAVLGLALIAAVLTFALEVPGHRRLRKQGSFEEGVRALVRDNRPRPRRHGARRRLAADGGRRLLAVVGEQETVERDH